MTDPDRFIPSNAAQAASNARRIVIKVGSSLIAPVSNASGANLLGLCADVGALKKNNKEVCLVSSGAVALGREGLQTMGNTLADRQALSAIGQIRLLRRWEEALGANDLIAAQVLLTPDITGTRRRYLNARAAMRALLSVGAVPVINENDTVATEELRYGDNDRLAAMAAGIIGADLLILFTDTDGLYTKNPFEHSDAEHIPTLTATALTNWDRRALGPTSSVGTGGMASKLDAAQLAGAWGTHTLIASGLGERPLKALIDGASKATLCLAAKGHVPARRRWLEGLQPQRGSIVIDAGAANALREGKSLLSVGVRQIKALFTVGDVVGVHTEEGTLGFGLARADANAVKDRSAKVVIHRDDFVLENTNDR
ncbi:MAG: glutamate 5-kinase [Pseudomonadota bacterium]